MWSAAAAFAIAVMGVSGVLVASLGSAGDAETTVMSAAPTIPPAAVATPAAAPPHERTTAPTSPARVAPQTKPKTTTTTKKPKPSAMTVAECNRLAANSMMPNAELGPYLRSRGCNTTADSLLVGPAPQEVTSVEPAEAALQACREQTGQTTAQCIDQSRRGLAN